MEDHDVLELDGVEKLFLKIEHQKHFHVIIGEDVTKQDPFAFISKAALVDQLDSFTYSFDPVREKIQNYEGEEMLLLYADADEADGHNFLVCVTEEAKNTQLRRRASPDRRGRVDGLDAGGGGGGAEKARRQFVSAAPGAAEAEIAAAAVVNSRPRIRLKISRQRKFFGAPAKFGDREAHDGMEECRPYKDPNYSIIRAEDDFSIQAVPARVHAAAQTTRNMPVAAAVQTEPQVFSPDKANLLAGEAPLAAFVAAKAKIFCHALQQNEAVDIYSECFASADDDAGFGRENEPLFVEQSTFSEVNRVCGSLTLQPGNRNIIAVSSFEPISLDDRIAASNTNQPPSVVAVWNGAVTLHSHPQLLLRAPADVAVVRFCPSHPHLIAGGLITGQVIVWDVAEPLARLAASAAAAADRAQGVTQRVLGPGLLPGNVPAAGPSGLPMPPGVAAASSSSSGPVLVDHILLSPTEASHRRAVTELHWLPPGHEISSSGAVRSDPGILSHQMVTSGFDGQVAFWDINARKDVTRDRVWRALMRVPFTRVSRPGDHAVLRMTIDPARALIVGGTEDGEVVTADWRALRADQQALQQAANAGASSAQSMMNTLGAQGAKRKAVMSAVPAHCSPVTAIERHPSIPSLVLSAGDCTFAIWQEDVDQPLLVSPPLAADVTAAKWSPTRPSVLFVARADGFVEVWDLLERTHAASRTENATSSARITEIEVVTYAEARGRRRQSLVVADESGCLRVLAIPRALTRPAPREHEFMLRYVARELDRVRFFETVIAPQRSAPSRAAAERNETPLPGEERAAAAPAPSAAAGAGAATGHAPGQVVLSPEEAAQLAEDKAAEAAYAKFKAEFERHLELMMGGAAGKL